MKYLIDTNIYIAYLNGKSLKVKSNFLKQSPDDIILCSVVKAELIYGAMKSQKVEKSLSYFLNDLSHFLLMINHLIFSYLNVVFRISSNGHVIKSKIYELNQMFNIKFHEEEN